MTATTSAHQNAMTAVYGETLGNLAFPIDTLLGWQLAALEKLSRLHGLKPNWDSYGSPPISDDVLEIAQRLVGEANVDAPTPRVVPVSGGGVQVEWEHGTRLFVVLVRSDFSIEVYAEDGSGNDPLDATLPSLNPAALIKILSWLAE